jgi:hypothetical protein
MTIGLVAMTGRQKGNDGPEKGRAPVSIARVCTCISLFPSRPPALSALPIGVLHSTTPKSLAFFFFGNTDMSYRIYEVKRGVWVCDKGIKKPHVNT